MKKLGFTRWWLCLLLLLVPATASSAEVLVPMGNTVVVIQVGSLAAPTAVPAPAAHYAVYHPGQVASMTPTLPQVSLCIQVMENPMPLNGLVGQATSPPPVIVVIDVPVTHSGSSGNTLRRMW